MQLRFHLGALTLAASLLASALHAQIADSTVARVDALFARWATDSTPGCTIGISRDGAVVLARAYGMANLEYGVRNTPETIFEGGSVSKQFTAAAVALLARDGKLDLDDDIRKYVPELPDYGAPVRIRHMLNHTSGLRDWGTIAAAEGWPRGSRSHTHDDVLRILGRQKALNFPPGTEYLYSNSNYTLLAILVERLSGTSFAEFTRARIFQPRGMTRTSWRDDFTRVVRNRSTAYASAGDEWYMDMPFENAHGHGGLLTTVGDLLAWSRNFSDTLVGGGWLASEMLRRGRLNNGGEIRYALGLSIEPYRGLPSVSHSGATAGYRAYLVRFPEERTVIAILCNAANANTTSLARQVADIVLAGRFAAPPAPAANGFTPSAADLERRAGLYRSLRDNEPMALVVRDGALHVVEGPALSPLSATTFLLDGGPTRFEFVVDARGRTTRLLVPTSDGDTTRYEPVTRWTPAPRELAGLEGEYRSEEVGVSYRLAREGGNIVLHAPRRTPLELAPAYRDALVAPATGSVVLLHRDTGGAITAISIGFGRARAVRFTKVK